MNEDDKRMLSLLKRATNKSAFISALEESAREYSARPPAHPASANPQIITISKEQ